MQRITSPLSAAVHVDCVRSLLDNGADARLSNAAGQTPSQTCPRLDATAAARQAIGELVAAALAATASSADALAAGAPS